MVPTKQMIALFYLFFACFRNNGLPPHLLGRFTRLSAGTHSFQSWYFPVLVRPRYLASTSPLARSMASAYESAHAQTSCGV